VPTPPACLDNSCGGVLERIGLGVQRVEEELAAALPGARILRLDRDTLRRAADYRSAVERMLAHDVDVLLGTQVVAKGLDFPEVRLVGVIEADAGLALPDFRAGEHVFALLMQVVGRAGRRAGESLAVVQSDDADSPLIARAVRMDYESFAADELEARRRWFLPPFSRLIRCVLADERPGRARQEAERLAANLRAVAERVHPEIRVDDAQVCCVPRLHDRLRWNVLVRLPRGVAPPALLAPAATARTLSPRVRRFRVDVDPIDML
jgi:primosomal protein N' (replication factor Y)